MNQRAQELHLEQLASRSQVASEIRLAEFDGDTGARAGKRLVDGFDHSKLLELRLLEDL